MDCFFSSETGSHMEGGRSNTEQWQRRRGVVASNLWRTSMSLVAHVGVQTKTALHMLACKKKKAPRLERGRSMAMAPATFAEGSYKIIPILRCKAHFVLPSHAFLAKMVRSW